MTTSFAPRALSLRLAASMIMTRNVPVALRVSPRSRRSITCPVKSRPSRREPSHSDAASCALRQLRESWTAPPTHVCGSKRGWLADDVQGSCIGLHGARETFSTLCKLAAFRAPQAHTGPSHSLTGRLFVFPGFSDILRLSQPSCQRSFSRETICPHSHECGYSICGTALAPGSSTVAFRIFRVLHSGGVRLQ